MSKRLKTQRSQAHQGFAITSSPPISPTLSVPLGSDPSSTLPPRDGSQPRLHRVTPLLKMLSGLPLASRRKHGLRRAAERGRSPPGPGPWGFPAALACAARLVARSPLPVQPFRPQSPVSPQPGSPGIGGAACQGAPQHPPSWHFSVRPSFLTLEAPASLNWRSLLLLLQLSGMLPVAGALLFLNRWPGRVNTGMGTAATWQPVRSLTWVFTAVPD